MIQKSVETTEAKTRLQAFVSGKTVCFVVQRRPARLDFLILPNQTTSV
jgi:hypothetical protein